MIKLLFAWRDHAQRTPEECERHYREVHMGLAREAFEGADGFVARAYNRVTRHTVNDYNRRESTAQPNDIDAFLEMWFEDRERLEKAFGHPILTQMFEDHANFMDVDSPANIRTYEVVEDVYLGHRRT
jgi:uncharacterized protein (TIGR02118 family)